MQREGHRSVTETDTSKRISSCYQIIQVPPIVIELLRKDFSWLVCDAMNKLSNKIFRAKVSHNFEEGLRYLEILLEGRRRSGIPPAIS